MEPMTKIVTSVIVLLMDGIIVKINDSPFRWGPPGIPSKTPGDPQAPPFKITELEDFSQCIQ